MTIRNALTFDVEDYFHVEAAVGPVSQRDWSRYPPRVEANTGRILDLLEARGVAATFFVLGWVAEHHPKLVREIAARGHEVACHSYAHRPVSSLSRTEFREDLRRAKAVIEDLTGEALHGYRAPTFSVVRSSLWALDILAEEGFEYDSSIFPIHHDRYGIPEATRFPHHVQLAAGAGILEFPMTTLLVAGQRLPFCGGGYFRLAPYGLVRAAIRHVNGRERQPAIVYLHPWEFDPGQPRLPLRGLNRFRQYVNLSGTARKLERLLDDFAFSTARDVLQQCRAAGALA
jgi:polysaccharide deacetylase family protein (PEP-CTERM system associated)